MEGKTDQFDNLKSKPKKFYIKMYHKESQNSIFKLGEKKENTYDKGSLKTEYLQVTIICTLVSPENHAKS